MEHRRKEKKTDMNRQHWKRDYGILWAGQAISVLTSSILQMALIWHLTAVTQSAAVLSMASLAGFLPNAVLGMAAGTLADRISRKAAMIAADLFIAAVSLVLVFVTLDGTLEIWLILAVLAARSVGTAFHTPAISATTPLLVPAEELTRCAGYTHSLQTVGFIAGTAIASVLYPIWSLSSLVALDVAGAVAACAAVAVIRIPGVERREAAAKPDFLREMKEGYVVLKQQKGLYTILWTAAIFMILYSPVNALFPLMSLDHFGGTTVHASAAEIAFAAACAVMGFSVPLYNAPTTALYQERIAPEYLGRVFGLYGSVCSMAMPIGLVISGLFADRVGTPRWFVITGALLVMLAVWMYLMPSIRNLDRQQVEQTGEM